MPGEDGPHGLPGLPGIIPEVDVNLVRKYKFLEKIAFFIILN